MFIKIDRLISYLLSLIVVFLSLYLIPLDQSLKYLIFILINFFLITSSVNKKNLIKNTYLLILISLFFLSYLIIYNLNFKFALEIKSFNKENTNELSTNALNFFEENYPNCLKSDCFEKNNYDIKFNKTFYHNTLNINNIHELRTNIFYIPGSTFGKNKFIDKYNYPYEISFDFPKYYYGSKLCYQTVNSSNICKIINTNQNQFKIIGVGEKIKINLEKNNFIIFVDLLLVTLFLVFNYFILNQIVSFRIRDKFELLYPIALVFWLVIFSLTNDAKVNFLNSYFYQYPGGDGYWYLVLSNILSEYLLQFEIVEFLKGGAVVFYYMPGMRYFVAIEKFIFGNSYYLHLIIISFLPFLIRRLLNIYLSDRLTYILLFSFLLFPVMHHMGFSLYQYIRYASKVFAEPVAYTIFIYGFIRLIYYYKDKKKYINSIPFTTLILCISCLLRPNLSPSSFFLLIIPYVELIIKRDVKNIILTSLFGSIIFLPFLHNYFFGNKFVLFTIAVFAEVNIKLTLSDYLTYLTTFDLEKEKKIMLVEIAKNFFNPYEIHKYFILLGVFLSFNLKNLKNVKLLPLYILIFSQFYLFLFLNPGPRYIWIFWLAALILSFYSFTNRKLKE